MFETENGIHYCDLENNFKIGLPDGIKYFKPIDNSKRYAVVRTDDSATRSILDLTYSKIVVKGIANCDVPFKWSYPWPDFLKVWYPDNICNAVIDGKIAMPFNVNEFLDYAYNPGKFFSFIKDGKPYVYRLRDGKILPDKDGFKGAILPSDVTDRDWVSVWFNMDNKYGTAIYNPMLEKVVDIVCLNTEIP